MLALFLQSVHLAFQSILLRGRFDYEFRRSLGVVLVNRTQNNIREQLSALAVINEILQKRSEGHVAGGFTVDGDQDVVLLDGDAGDLEIGRSAGLHRRQDDGEIISLS